MEPKSREPQAPAQDQEEPSLPDLGERANAIRSRLGAADADLIANAPADLAYLLAKLGVAWTIATSAVRLALRRRIERDDARAEAARLKRELEHLNRRLERDDG